MIDLDDHLRPSLVRVCDGPYVWPGMNRFSVAWATLYGHAGLLALRPPRNKVTRWNDLFLSTTL